jgi:hypothetical protein
MSLTVSNTDLFSLKFVEPSVFKKTVDALKTTFPIAQFSITVPPEEQQQHLSTDATDKCRRPSQQQQRALQIHAMCASHISFVKINFSECAFVQAESVWPASTRTFTVSMASFSKLLGCLRTPSVDALTLSMNSEDRLDFEVSSESSCAYWQMFLLRDTDYELAAADQLEEPSGAAFEIDFSDSQDYMATLFRNLEQTGSTFKLIIDKTSNQVELKQTSEETSVAISFREMKAKPVNAPPTTTDCIEASSSPKRKKQRCASTPNEGAADYNNDEDDDAEDADAADKCCTPKSPATELSAAAATSLLESNYKQSLVAGFAKFSSITKFLRARFVVGENSLLLVCFENDTVSAKFFVAPLVDDTA